MSPVAEGNIEQKFEKKKNLPANSANLVLAPVHQNVTVYGIEFVYRCKSCLRIRNGQQDRPCPMEWLSCQVRYTSLLRGRPIGRPKNCLTKPVLSTESETELNVIH